MYYIDTETCGLHGLPVLLQYAKDDGEIELWNFWTNPISESIELIERIADEGVIGFNLAFDWFHLYKIWTLFKSYPHKDEYPEDIIDNLGELEERCRDYPDVLKPRHCFDVMLHARKGPYQNTMDREEIRIKRVPSLLAHKLAHELDSRIKINDIYFARRKEKIKNRWKVYDIEDENGEIETEFRDVVLKFAPSSALKALAVDALNIQEDLILLFTDVEVPKAFYPIEYGYAPFAKAGIIEPRYKRLLETGKGQWRRTWPDVIEFHIEHWETNKLARQYAEKDIVYTRDLYKFFGSPDIDDNDSILSCMVACCRWRGYKIDREGVQKLRLEAIKKSKTAPMAPNRVRAWLEDAMSKVEKLTIAKSTGKIILEEIAGWQDHEAGKRAKAVLEARAAKKQVEIYDKLLQAGRFHASFKVIGTLSTRMSGGDGLNPQGINRTKTVRSQFFLAQDGMVLCGGDFDAFEVSIAEAVYNDEKLRANLLSGMKIHALFGTHFFPEYSYEQILESSGSDNDMYNPSKSGFFALIYGGTEFTLQTRIGVSSEVAEEGFKSFQREYQGIKKFQEGIYNDFCSMRQPGGLGTKVEWYEPKEYVESFLGFRRYFTLENKIAKVLFELGENPPKSWKDLKLKVVRRDREQTLYGATQSACFGAAFAIQAANMRAASNHLIQSPGAQITKDLQCKLWDFQPVGVSKWLVQPLNIHDEVMCPADPEIAPKTKEIVDDFVNSMKPKVPLIQMGWVVGMKDWSSK